MNVFRWEVYFVEPGNPEGRSVSGVHYEQDNHQGPVRHVYNEAENPGLVSANFQKRCGLKRRGAMEGQQRVTNSKLPSPQDLADYDITPLATVLKLRRVLQNAPIPSPLWSGALRWPYPDNRLFARARDLYQEISNQRLTLLEEIKTQADFHDSGRSKGLLCWLEYRETTSIFSEDSDDESGAENPKHIPRDLNYAWVDETMDLDLNALKAESKGKHGVTTAGIVLDICRLERISGVGDAQPGTFGHFIVNFDQASLSVNGIPIRMGVIAGPLPQFAVVDIDGSILFWWGADTALNFVPVEPSTNPSGKRSFEESQVYEDLGEAYPEAKRPNIRTTTSKIGISTQEPSGQGLPTGFNTGLTAEHMRTLHAEWRAEFRRTFKKCTKTPSSTTNLEAAASSNSHRLNEYQNLGMDDVVLAIAALRFGNGNGDLDYCFGESDLYAHTRKQRERGIACGGTSNSFIIPLFFDQLSNSLEGEPSSSDKPQPMESFSEFQLREGPPSKLKHPGNSALRHCMFALARCSDDLEDVTIEYYDSKPGAEGRDLIRETARNLVRNSGWLRDKWPKWASERWHPCPRQIGETSGIHTILNAWCVMINLEVNKNPSYKIRGKFYAKALKVINLGLDGKLDSLTIRAFLQRYKYAQTQTLATAKKHDSDARYNSRALLTRRTTWTNRGILQRVITAMHEEEHSPEPSAEKQKETQTSVEVYPWDKILQTFLSNSKRMMKSKTLAIPDTFALYDEQVHVAIGAVWESMRRAGVHFAFGDLYTFRGRREQSSLIPNVEAVLGPAPLIMPLFFGQEMPSKDAQGGRTEESMGHHVFAVASILDAQGLIVKVMDSSPGTRSSQEIGDALTGLVKFTGWLGVDAERQPLPVRHTIYFQSTNTPRQEGNMSCGFYIILNAWATMLGIDIHPGPQRRVDTTWQHFMEDGLTLINMALLGHVDSITIQAFMNLHGYSAMVHETTPVLPIKKIVAMDLPKLDQIVWHLRDLALYSRLQSTESVSAQGMDQGPTEYPEEDIARLIASGSNVTANAAHVALSMTGGNVDEAIAYLHFPPG
ncbi:hypothetical protein MMC07_004049 [Pseudocyphellaria aurata]|nr:hypothetical protein [Pseudocyphellaria aurata]